MVEGRDLQLEDEEFEGTCPRCGHPLNSEECLIYHEEEETW